MPAPKDPTKRAEWIKNLKKSHTGLKYPNKKPMSPEHRKSLSENHADVSGDKNPMYGVHLIQSEESNKKRSLKLKDRPVPLERRFRISKKLLNHPVSDETRLRISKGREGKRKGADHPMWKGGVAFEPYCLKFNENLKESVRHFFGDQCVLCGRDKSENYNRKLAVHHVFTEKMACCETRIQEMDAVRARLPKEIAHFGSDTFTDEEISYIRMMVPLCLKCHGKQNRKSEDAPYEQTIYRKYFTEMIMTKYDGQCYLPKEEPK